MYEQELAQYEAELSRPLRMYSWQRLRKDLWWSTKWAAYFSVWTTMAVALLWLIAASPAINSWVIQGF